MACVRPLGAVAKSIAFVQSDEEDGSDSDEDDNSEGWDTDETGTDISHESEDEADADAAKGAKKAREPKKLK